jgi:indolepyruvate ferredoxin oxidoreductase alpha subunit
VAAIDNTCVACGNCGEVAEAAVLCPSFFRADVVHNPTKWDQFKAKWTMKVITYLQRRRASRRVQVAVA